MLDVFNSDAFSAVELTDRIIKAPFKPGRIGSMNLFVSRGVRNTTIVVEEKDGRLSLIPTSPRGGPADTIGAKKRTVRSFIAPHLERESTVMADEVQDVRAFGSEEGLESVQMLVDERLSDLRGMHEVTLEYHRIGAIQGKVLDADGTTEIFDLFTEFGVTQQTKDIALGTETTNVRTEVTAAKRLSENELGGLAVTGYVGLCSDGWFDDFVEHAKVAETLKYQDSATLREDIREGFRFAGVNWENYRGKVAGAGGDVDFIPDDEAVLVPTADIYRTYYAPADFIEAANTIGLPIYSKIVPDRDLDRWVKVHSQSNPLCICLRPRAVIRLTKS
jgi:hypothetical protein